MAHDAGMEEIHQIFFDESLEGLEVMEQGLLNLDVGQADPVVINDIFRAAHSIKGGGGTFGFHRLSEFTHGVETLLDQMREGVRAVSQDLVDLLLQSVDCLRNMLSAAQRNEADPADTQRLSKAIERELGSDGFKSPHSHTESTSQSPWLVCFKPHDGMLKTGSDPVPLMKSLTELGDVDIEVNTHRLPDFDSLDPQVCHLDWQIRLIPHTSTQHCEKDIREIFDWVEADADLQITRESDDVTSTMADCALPTATEARPVTRQADKSNESIRVNLHKVDELINLVGELVITQSMLSRYSQQAVTLDQIASLQQGLTLLNRNTRELQESVMQIRMLPISTSFNRFPRLVRDITQKLGKQVELKLTGADTELDKTVLEKINDPLVHLVRNSLDHGLEVPEQRLTQGKSKTGLLELKAYHEGGSIIIEVIDDGAGINLDKVKAIAIEKGLIDEHDRLSNEQTANLIFQPGFSTAESVSDLSGRGVGMDVVKQNINSLGGQVYINTQPGKGSVTTIILPLTLAILDGQLFSAQGQVYIIPLVSIVESLQIQAQNVKAVVGQHELYCLRDEYIPVIRLSSIFQSGLPALSSCTELELLIVVELENQRYGIVVDELLEQQQVVIKSLDNHYKKIQGVSGATILGNGLVALIIDIAGLIQAFKKPIKRVA